MEILLVIVGLIAGIGIGFLLMKTKGQSQLSELQQTIADKENAINLKGKELEISKNEINNLNQEVKSEAEKHRESEIKLATLESDYKNLEVRYKEHKEQVKELQSTFKNEFENLANDIVKKQTKDFSDQNSNLLKPFREQLKSFETTVQSQMKDSIEKAATFKEQIEQLKNLNLQISEEATNLTNALKGDNKLQGNWGELILERVLESSGLEKGSEYKTQVNLQNADDTRIIPDAIIYLPDDKHIIVDSKVSLVAYEKYVNTSDEEEKSAHLKAHLNSVKAHVKGLSEKKYQTAEGLTSPDFILLFIPIEASFGAAVKEDVSLFNFAWDKNIVIVSPSTLLATLKTVSSLWKQEKQNKNVLKIADESGKLYDKFVGFLKDIDDIEKSFDRTAKQFSEVQKKLHNGTGNIVGRIEKIKTLGAKATKQIDGKYLEE